MEVLVFSTSVESKEQVRLLAPKINQLQGVQKWNFALDDRDRILRIVTDKMDPRKAIIILNQHGFECKELE